MAVDVEIRGDVERLRAVGRALKEVDKQQKRELYKAVQRATKPIKEEIKQAARSTLPSSGGLNTWVASLTIRTKQSYNGRVPGVTITGGKNNKGRRSGGGKRRRRSRRAGTFGASADLRALNRGRVMHPVFGRGPLVGPEHVTAGFWDRPLEGVAMQRAKQEIRDAMSRVVRDIARSS